MARNTKQISLQLKNYSCLLICSMRIILNLSFCDIVIVSDKMNEWMDAAMYNDYITSSRY